MAETMDNTGLLAELINANGRGHHDGASNMWNNPFMYLIWLAMFGNGFGFGNRNNPDNGAQNTQNAEFMSRLNSIESQIQDNQNNNLAYQAITGNGKALEELAGNLNVGVVSLGQTIDRINVALAEVGGKVGMSSERVINAISQGNMNIIQTFKDCCCSTQKEILNMGYQSQLANKDLQNAMQMGFSSTNAGIERGFSNLGFTAQQNKCEIVTAIGAAQQRTADLLQQHWQMETSQALQDAKFEISQLKQTQYLAEQISNKSTTTTTA